MREYGARLSIGLAFSSWLLRPALRRGDEGEPLMLVPHKKNTNLDSAPRDCTETRDLAPSNAFCRARALDSPLTETSPKNTFLHHKQKEKKSRNRRAAFWSSKALAGARRQVMRLASVVLPAPLRAIAPATSATKSPKEEEQSERGERDILPLPP